MPRLRRLFILGIVAALVISYVGPIRGYRERQAELRQQEIELKALVGERDAIRAKLARSNTPAGIEARARELGFIKPGEVQYRIENLDGVADGADRGAAATDGSAPKS